MAENEKGVGEEAKGFSQEIVATLGLVELILGGVALYGLSLIFKESSLGKLFPSTGTSVVDIGIQIFAAALIGKIIYLLVAIPIAFGRDRLKNNTNYYTPLREALGKYYDAAALTHIEGSGTNLIDTALKHVSIADAFQRLTFERHRIRIIIAYGTCALILIFSFYLYFIKWTDTPASLFYLLVIAFIIFAIVGILEQRSLVSELTQALISLHRVEERTKEINQTRS